MPVTLGAVVIGAGLANRRILVVALGVVVLVGLLWLCSRPPSKAVLEAGWSWRDDVIGDPDLWSDEELEILATSESVDQMHGIWLAARERRSEEARGWFVHHYFSLGSEWRLSDPGGTTVTVEIRRLTDLDDRLPPSRQGYCFKLETLSIVAREYPRHRIVPERWPGARCRGDLPPRWEFRPASCECVMPGRRTRPAWTAPYRRRQSADSQ